MKQLFPLALTGKGKQPPLHNQTPLFPSTYLIFRESARTKQVVCQSKKCCSLVYSDKPHIL